MELNQVLVRSNRKTLSIMIDKNGDVIIKAPLHMKIDDINKFLMQKSNWIETKIASIKNVQKCNSDIISCEKFLLFGKKYLPLISTAKTFIFDDNNLYIPEKIESHQVVSKLKKYYKRYAKNFLSEHVQFIGKTIGFLPKKLKISDAKSRWGSCTSSGVISLNWRLILLDTKLLDYVIVHELCHLVHMNHSVRFWKKVSIFLPSYDLLRKKLKEHSYLLNLYRLS